MQLFISTSGGQSYIKMPIHIGLLPREGFTADPVLNLLSRTVLNPMLLLPIYLLARFTKKGEDLTMLHRTAYSRFKAIFYLALVRHISKRLSDGVANNWTKDRYNWSEEIAVVTGGAGGIGGHIVKLLAERGTKVVVLDIQPMTYDAGETPGAAQNKVNLNLADLERKVRTFTTSRATSPQPHS